MGAGPPPPRKLLEFLVYLTRSCIPNAAPPPSGPSAPAPRINLLADIQGRGIHSLKKVRYCPTQPLVVFPDAESDSRRDAPARAESPHVEEPAAGGDLAATPRRGTECKKRQHG